AVEIGEDLQATSAREQGLGLYLCEVDEQKFLGKGKIFAEKAEARKAASGPRKQRLFGGETGRCDYSRGNNYRGGIARAVGVSHRDRVRAQQLIERQRHVCRSAQKEAQAVDAEAGECGVARTAFEADAQHGDGAAGKRVGGGGKR